MTRLGAAFGIGALGILLVGLVFPAPAAAEFCLPTMPRKAADVRGHTFTARISEVRRESGPHWTFLTFDIGRVYASGGDPRVRAGSTLELYSNDCDGIHLMGIRRGDLVLISTSRLDGDGPSTWNSAVWRFTGGPMQLYVMRDEQGLEVWFNSDRRIEAVRSVQDALALVAPDSVGLPATDTGGTADPRWIVGAIGVAASVALIRRWLSSRRRLARGPTSAGLGSRWR